MTERAHAHADSERTQQQEDAGIAPGAASRSAQLMAPTQPIASGLLQRKARDANGVAEGADSAVASASTSSGFSLPDTLMRKFEGSLGADLSSVRVHTGGESAAAAEAVGARAYTTGQDIHFAAGQYDPTSSGGEHLLAHEVAHTVQQAGGAASGRQNKLSVSTPQDAAEHEADRAADAMVAGSSFRIGAMTSPSINRVPDYRPLFPKQVNWAQSPLAQGGPQINDIWQGPPAFIIPVKIPDGDVAANFFERAREAFASDWRTLQGNYNRVSADLDAHHDKSVSALALVDVKEGAGSLEENVARTTLPGTKTTIGQSFNIDDSLGGKNKGDASKLSREDRLAIDKAKKQVESKTDVVHAKADTATNKQNDLGSRCRDLQNSLMDGDLISEEEDKETAEREVEAMKKAAELINQAVESGSKSANLEKPKSGLLEGGFGVAKMINTLYWDSELSKIQGQLAVISGKMVSIKKAKARNAIETARANVQNAARDVVAAHSEYNIAMRERTTAYQELASLMASGASKSGASSGDASKIMTAVQAVPAIEMLIESAMKIVNTIGSPSCNAVSALGCGQASAETQLTISERVGRMVTTRKNMEQTVSTWSRRLSSVHALLNGMR